MATRKKGEGAPSGASGLPFDPFIGFERNPVEWLERLPETIALLRKMRPDMPARHAKLVDGALRSAKEALFSIRSGDPAGAAEAAAQAMWAAHYAWLLIDEAGLLPVIQTGRKQRSASEDANARKADEAEERAIEWQRRADEKWAEPQHSEKNPSEIARLIARDGEKPGTIRKKIKKKLA